MNKRVYTYSCNEGKTASYRANLNMEMDMEISEGLQEAKISNISGFELGYTERCLRVDKDGNMDVEIIFDLVKIKVSMNFFGALVDVYIDNDYLKAYRDGVLIADTRKGIGMAMAHEFFKDLGLYKKSGKFKASPLGTIISWIEGDEEVIRLFESANIAPELPLQILVFTERPINRGDTWDFSFILEKMEKVTFKTPLKQVNRFTLEGLAEVNGIKCIQISLDSPLNAKDIKAVVRMGDADMSYDVRNMSRKATGNFYFDHTNGRFIFGKVTADAKIDLSTINPETKKNLNMNLTVKMDLNHLRTTQNE